MSGGKGIEIDCRYYLANTEYILVNFLRYEIARSRAEGGRCHIAAKPLVDRGGQRPHDGGVRTLQMTSKLRRQIRN